MTDDNDNSCDYRGGSDSGDGGNDDYGDLHHHSCYCENCEVVAKIDEHYDAYCP